MRKKTYSLKDSVKDSIMMPPPKAITVISHSDTSEELRRNLLESSSNKKENNRLYRKIMNELTYEDDISIPCFLKESKEDLNELVSTECLSTKKPEEKRRLAGVDLRQTVENLLGYLRKDTSAEGLRLTIELETRMQDYMNQALRPEYFRERLCGVLNRINKRKFDERLGLSVETVHSETFCFLQRKRRSECEKCSDRDRVGSTCDVPDLSNTS